MSKKKDTYGYKGELTAIRVIGKALHRAWNHLGPAGQRWVLRWVKDHQGREAHE